MKFTFLALLSLLLHSFLCLGQDSDPSESRWKFGARYAYGISAHRKTGWGERYVQHGTAAISLTAEKNAHWLAISAPWITRSGFKNYNSRIITQQNSYRYRFFPTKMVRPFVGGSLIYESTKTEGIQYDTLGITGYFTSTSDRRSFTDISITPDVGVEIAYKHFRLDLVAQGIAGIQLMDLTFASYRTGNRRGKNTSLDAGRGQPFKTIRTFQIGLGYVF